MRVFWTSDTVGACRPPKASVARFRNSMASSDLAGSAAGLAGALVVGMGALFTALPGLVLTPSNGAWVTLTMMLGTALAGLLSALYVRRINALEGD